MLQSKECHSLANTRSCLNIIDVFKRGFQMCADFKYVVSRSSFLKPLKSGAVTRVGHFITKITCRDNVSEGVVLTSPS